MTSGDLAEQKAELRRQARADRDALQSGLGAAAATGLVARFGQTPELRALMTPDYVFAGYMPIGSEIDCQPLMRRLASVGVPLCLPVVVQAETPLVFRRWSEGDPVVTGSMGISEPTADAQQVLPDVLLVPMLAFDRKGYRLGYGGGFYDMTLEHLRAQRDVIAIGVAFAGQVRDKVPVSGDDQRLDWILTEVGASQITAPGNGT